MMKEIAITKVSKIVAQNYKTAAVFSSYGIDFCCNGGISLKDACAGKGVDLEQVVTEVEAALQSPVPQDYQAMGLPELVEHIVTVHHQYVTNTIPVLQAYLDKLGKVHGERHPELHQIKALFDESAEALAAHMKKEEQILFPYIRAMADAKTGGFTLSPPHFGTIENPIEMMEAEHAAEGDRFREISELSNQYTPPADGCQTYRVAFAVLDEFEKDLHKHIHLENNILFPKAISLFEEFNLNEA